MDYLAAVTRNLHLADAPIDNAGISINLPIVYDAPAPDDSDSESDSGSESSGADGDPPMGFTENNSLTYKATGNPCLDLFFHVVPDTPARDLVRRLERAWRFDPLTTLKLVCNLRGVRGTGKMDKEGWYTSALWLHQRHPKTLASNLRAFANFGYFKDLVEVLYRVVEGCDVRETQKREWRRRKGTVRRRKQLIINAAKAKARRERELAWSDEAQRADMEGVVHWDDDTENDMDMASEWERKITCTSKKAFNDYLCVWGWRKPEDVQKPEDAQKPVRYNFNVAAAAALAYSADEFRPRANAEVHVTKETARILRKEKEIAKAKKASDKYLHDSAYRNLHDQVAHLFARVLKMDIGFLSAGEPSKISLAAKWCPSIDSSYDKATLICKNIATRLFPQDEEPEYAGIAAENYAYRIRNRLRKEVLVPLRKALQLPEVYMSAKQWGLLPYNRVASVAMRKYTGIFKKHDKARFDGYLEDVKSGKAKIAAGALLPHEIVASLHNEDGKEVAELQWTRMVDDLLEKGKLRNCMAICDVSGSMRGTPMEVCVALGLLVSELSEDPWKGKVITFSADPQLHEIVGDSLFSKTSFIRSMKWGMNTDFQKVFDRILDVAVENKLSEDQMVQRLFVFSDMEFDQASRTRPLYSYGYQSLVRPKIADGWATDYQVIRAKYKKHGYDRIPEIVFWNLRDSSSTPVTAYQSGVALLSGFSKNLLTMFLDGDITVKSPVEVMQLAISGEEYTELVVVD